MQNTVNQQYRREYKITHKEVAKQKVFQYKKQAKSVN